MLRQLCCLLHSVAEEEAMSLMDSRGLAVVMTPNIMPTQHSDPTLLQSALMTNTGPIPPPLFLPYLLSLLPSPPSIPPQAPLSWYSVCAGIVQLLIDHAHLIGLAPPRLISHAHQLAEEDSTNEISAAASNDSLDGRLEEVKEGGKRDKQRRGSVTGQAKYRTLNNVTQ